MHHQVGDDLLNIHGNENDGSYFLGSKYSMADLHPTPFLQRASKEGKAQRGVDVLDLMADNGLHRYAELSSIVASLSAQERKNGVSSVRWGARGRGGGLKFWRSPTATCMGPPPIGLDCHD